MSENIIAAQGNGNEMEVRKLNLKHYVKDTEQKLYKTVKNNELIMHFGSFLFDKLGIRREHDVNLRMQQLYMNENQNR